MTVSAVILAAGRSSRFEDGHKLLVEIDGIPVVRHVCQALAASDVADIVLVTSEANGAVAKAAGPGRWRVAENPDARDGLSTSLRAGLKSISQDVDGLLVALADMPAISTELVNALVSAFRSNPAAIVFPVASDGRRGHPILWPKSLFPELMTVTGDSGGRAILTSHQALWRPVPCDDEGAFADIDTRADLEAFKARDQAMRRK
ncbi:NTP transferase domain-containing protein [Hyphomicrobium sp. MC1]|uniref:nucleotidyltransferase family protein n=1 Tax=Hyphomicrobium sp. (strain MC1) TaxID=717785 RepID=UPI000213DCBC|nr:nucleotidyltransferase family protein [Hyphomicrobium sp. MC1]CCB63835.1 putative molybdopterin-guanine dinucleotide biosynthesis protein A [Hyphomicrobium sp. MC1]